MEFDPDMHCEQNNNSPTKKVYHPQCLILVSRLPYYSLFKQILTAVYQKYIKTNEFESIFHTFLKTQKKERKLLSNMELYIELRKLIYGTPLAPPGKIQVSFQFCEKDFVYSIPD